MIFKVQVFVIVLLALMSTPVYSQAVGSSVSLQYGTVKSVEVVQAKSTHARGALLGGLAGAVVSDGHPGLGAVSGGLLGAGIEGHRTGKHKLQQISVSLMGGGAVVIDTEQHDIVVGDCVVVEQGQYANIRRVGGINCQREQTPPHHVSAADNCQRAKDELNMAKTGDEVNVAVIKVKTLCED